MSVGWQSPQEVQEKVKDRLSNIIWANRKLSRLQEHPGGLELLTNELVKSLEPLLELRTPPEVSENTLEQFGEKNNLDPNVVKGFSNFLFKKPASHPDSKLWKHQCKATEIINLPENKDGMIIATPTASGKTEAALFPVLNHIRQNPEPGIKAVLIYPTVTLATDQSKRILKMLNEIHQYPGRTIRFALMDGDTEQTGQVNQPARGLTCPTENCGEILQYSGEETTDLKCKHHGTQAPWFYATRNSIRANKENIDILVTGPEMLERLMLPGFNNLDLSKLDFVIYDEAHVWRGAQGASIRFLNSRLKYRSPQARFILLSATVKKPAKLFSDLISIEGFKSDLEKYVVEIKNTKQDRETKDFNLSNLPRVHNWPSLIQLLAGHSDPLYDGERLDEFIADNNDIIGNFFPSLIETEDSLSRFKDEIIATGWWDNTLNISPEGQTFSNILDSNNWQNVNWYESQNSENIKIYFDKILSSLSNAKSIIELIRNEKLKTLDDYVKIIELYDVIWPTWVSNSEDKKEAIHSLVGLSRISEFSRDKYHIWYRANISVYWNEKKQILTTSETRDMHSHSVCVCPRCGAAFYNKLEEYVAIPFTENQINCNFCKPDERGRTKFNRSKPIPLQDKGLAGISTASYISSALYHDLGLQKHLVFSDSVKTTENLSNNLMTIEPTLLVGRYLMSLYSDDEVYKISELEEHLSSELKAKYLTKFQSHIQNLNAARMTLDDIYNDKIKPLKHSHNWHRIWNDVLLFPKIPKDSITSWYDSVAHTSLFRYILCKKPYAGPYQEFSYQKNQSLNSLNPFNSDYTIHGMPWNEISIGNKQIKGLKQVLLKDFNFLEDKELDDLGEAFDRAIILAYRIRLIRPINDDDRDKLANGLTDIDFNDLQKESGNQLSKELSHTFGGCGWLVSEHENIENLEIEIPKRVITCETCFRPDYSKPSPSVWLSGDYELGSSDKCLHCGAETLSHYSRIKDNTFGPIDSNENKFNTDHNAWEFSNYKPNALISFPHHGAEDKDWRSFVELSFKKSLQQVTSSTPTFELGIDIGGLNATTGIGVPPYQANYMQRTGRAGRSRPEPSYCFTVVRTISPRDNYHFKSPNSMRRYITNENDIYIQKANEVREVLVPHLFTEILLKWLSNSSNLHLWDEKRRLSDNTSSLYNSVLQSITILINRQDQRSLIAWTIDNKEDLIESLIDCFGGKTMDFIVKETLDDLLSDKGFTSRINNWFKKYSEGDNREGVRTDSIFEQISSEGGGIRRRFFEQQYPDLLQVMQDRGLFAMYRMASSTLPEHATGVHKQLTTRGEDYVLRTTPPPEPDLFKGNKKYHATPRFRQQGILREVKQVVLNKDSILDNPVFCNNVNCYLHLRDMERDIDSDCPACEREYEKSEYRTSVSEISHVSTGKSRGWGGATSSNITKHVGEVVDSDIIDCKIQLNEEGISFHLQHAKRELIEYVNKFKQDGSKTWYSSSVIIEKTAEEQNIDPTNVDPSRLEQERSIDGVFHAGRKLSTGVLKITFDDESQLSGEQQLDPDNIARMVSFIHGIISGSCIVQHLERDDLDFHYTVDEKGRTVGYLMETVRGNQGVLRQTYDHLRNQNSSLVSHLVRIKDCECGSYCPKCLMHGRGIDHYLENNLISIKHLKEIV